MLVGCNIFSLIHAYMEAIIQYNFNEFIIFSRCKFIEGNNNFLAVKHITRYIPLNDADDRRIIFYNVHVEVQTGKSIVNINMCRQMKW